MRRSNVVVGGNSYTTGDISPRNWIKHMRLPDGRRPRMDLYGHNPFTLRRPDLRQTPSPSHPGSADFSDLDSLWGWLDRNGYRDGRRRRLRVFISEWTLPTEHVNTEFNFFVTRDVQARWLADALRIVRRTPRIYTLGWYSLYDDPPSPAGDEVNRGLLDYQGAPKPSYAAFRDGWAREQRAQQRGDDLRGVPGANERQGSVRGPLPQIVIAMQGDDVLGDVVRLVCDEQTRHVACRDPLGSEGRRHGRDAVRHRLDVLHLQSRPVAQRSDGGASGVEHRGQIVHPSGHLDAGARQRLDVRRRVLADDLDPDVGKLLPHVWHHALDEEQRGVDVRQVREAPDEDDPRAPRGPGHLVRGCSIVGMTTTSAPGTWARISSRSSSVTAIVTSDARTIASSTSRIASIRRPAGTPSRVERRSSRR